MGSVSRSITLPQRVQADQVSARYEHGELILTLPKAEEVKPRQIKIDVQGRQELSGGTAAQGGTAPSEGSSQQESVQQ